MSRYVRVDETTWPIDRETPSVPSMEWLLRYGDPMPHRLFIASIVHAYNHLLDPDISLADATRSLRRARKAAKETPPRPQER
jgi:hypothetical protein